MEGEIITGGVRRTQQMGHWLAVGLRECPQSRGAHTGAAKNERLAFSGVECLAHCPDRGIVVLSAAHRNMAISNALRFRSEEHTSEPQPLMRISYAVFCLK